MSNDRRRRGRRRRQQAGYQPAGPIEFPGFMGWLQRNQRAFYLGGILVMVLSLGGIVFATQFGGSTGGTSPTTSTDSTATPTAGESDEPAVGETPTGDSADEIVRSYSSAPDFTIDDSARYEAVIRTEHGEIRLELLPNEAPNYVNNFVFLARNRFYEGLTFHRVVPGFVVQAGDPTATGFGGAGYQLDEEYNALPFEQGVISMAKAGSTVNGSQFFITLAPTPHLAEDFTVFGRVTAGMDVLQATAPGDFILEIEIIEG